MLFVSVRRPVPPRAPASAGEFALLLLHNGNSAGVLQEMFAKSDNPQHKHAMRTFLAPHKSVIEGQGDKKKLLAFIEGKEPEPSKQGGGKGQGKGGRGGGRGPGPGQGQGQGAGQGAPVPVPQVQVQVQMPVPVPQAPLPVQVQGQPQGQQQWMPRPQGPAGWEGKGDAGEGQGGRRSWAPRKDGKGGGGDPSGGTKRSWDEMQGSMGYYNQGN